MSDKQVANYIADGEVEDAFLMLLFGDVKGKKAVTVVIVPKRDPV